MKSGMMRRRPPGERFFKAACAVCQGDFTSRIDRPNKYCSRACSAIGHMKPRPTCARCGKQRHDAKMPYTKYCGRECAAAASRTPRKPCVICGVRPTKLGQKTCSAACGYEHRKASAKPKVCPQCLVTFRPYPSAVARGSGKYCSRACYYAAVGVRPAMVEIACMACGTTFRRTQAAVKRTTRQFCSNACRSAFLVGPESTTWRGGASRGYRGPGWQRIAEGVRERDGRRCRRCGKPESEEPRRLSVDHVIPWRAFDDPEKANDPTNLVALCGSCHSAKARAERLWLKGDVLDMWRYQIAVAQPWRQSA